MVLPNAAPGGLRQYTKGRPTTHKEFEGVYRSLGEGGAGIKNRKESERMWRVSIDEIKACNWSLDFKNPATVFSVAHRTPTELLAEIEAAEKQIMEALKEIDFN